METWVLLVTLFCQLSSGLTTITPDEGGPQACNSCCQGPAGIPGVPGSAGIPGSNGLAGRDGLRGEMGLKGDIGELGGIGERGPLGPRGPGGDKGDRGFQGVPGKLGPKGGRGHSGVDGQPGSDGQPGTDGQPGLSGPKGSKGDMQQVQKSAFSVFKTSRQSGNIDDVLTFQRAVTSIGADFNMATNKFTCEIAGTYVFMFTIYSNYDNQHPYIQLMKDDSVISSARNYESSGSSNNFRSASNMAVLQLSVGDQVWLKFASSGEQVFSSPNNYSSFSGFLLYPE